MKRIIEQLDNGYQLTGVVFANDDVLSVYDPKNYSYKWAVAVLDLEPYQRLVDNEILAVKVLERKNNAKKRKGLRKEYGISDKDVAKAQCTIYADKIIEA